jgi:hypothetical protein
MLMKAQNSSPTHLTKGMQNASNALQGVRRSVFGNLLFLVLLVGGTLLAVVYYGTQKTVARLSASLIDATTSRVSSELRRFFEPASINLLVSGDWGMDGQLDIMNFTALNARFMPILKQNLQVTSMLIGNNNGDEYLLLRESDGWRNRLSRASEWGARSRWLSWDLDGELVEDNWREMDYDTRERPWFKRALSHPEGMIGWTKPYKFLTTGEPGITATLRWKPPGADNSEHVLAFDILLKDLSALTANLPVTPNGQLVVMTDEMRVIGLPADPRFKTAKDRASALYRRATNLQIPELTAAIEYWMNAGEQSIDPHSFSVDGDRYWAGFVPFRLGAGQRFWIGVIVPEKDLLGAARRQNKLLLFTTGGGLLVALLLAFLLDRRLHQRVGEEVKRVQQLGQYTLAEKLGEGGMGTVYRATHAMLRRPTAIKLLRAEKEGDEEAIARFEQEVQITSQLSHPNTVRIYDFGRTADGIFYYAMEYFGGTDLERLVDLYGPIPPDRTVSLLRQVCGSLAEAHGFGLIHRDIKPANIMLCERGGQLDVVKVLDFGMAKASGSDRLDLTKVNVVMGTPHYLAPEALRPDANVDGRSDLYAVGAMAWFMLMGRNLFEGDSPIEVARKHLNEEPRSIAEAYGPGIPHDLADLIMRCLEKDPDRRPHDAAHLGELFGECECAHDWTQRRAATWWQAHGEQLLPGSGAASKAASESMAQSLDIQV